MSTYRERRLARAARLDDWAEKNAAKAEAKHAAVNQIADMIPMGQPILAGHHSQGRHQRDVNRIQSGMSKAIELDQKAESQASRAANIRAAAEVAIYSDDPDAVEALQAKIARLEEDRTAIKAYNAAVRKGTANVADLPPDLERELAGIIRVGMDNNGGFPSFVATNIGGNISRLRKRLSALAVAS